MKIVLKNVTKMIGFGHKENKTKPNKCKVLIKFVLKCVVYSN